MFNRRTKEFKRLFSQLHESVQAEARKAYEIWLANPHQPGLNFHFLKDINIKAEPAGRKFRVFAIAIYRGYRVVGHVEAGTETYVWFWIGNHPEYMSRFKRGSTLTIPVP